MTFQEGDRVRFDCAGPHHLQGTGTVTWAGPVRFQGGCEHTVYLVRGDDPIQDKADPQFFVGDGEIEHVETPGPELPQG